MTPSEKRLIEAGKIVNTHGVHGEVKILPWADTPDFLAGFKHLYIDGKAIKVISARVHKGCVIAALEGVDGIDASASLKDKIVSIAKDEAILEEGRHFIADIIGLRAICSDTGEELGLVEDVLTLPANNVYVIRGAREILVPAVNEFIDEINIDDGYIKLRLIDGM